MNQDQARERGEVESQGGIPGIQQRSHLCPERRACILRLRGGTAPRGGPESGCRKIRVTAPGDVPGSSVTTLMAAGKMLSRRPEVLGELGHCPGSGGGLSRK